MNSSSSEQLTHSSYEASLRNIASSDALRSASSASSSALGPVQEPAQHRLPPGEFNGRTAAPADAQQRLSHLNPQQQQQEQQQQQQQQLEVEQLARRSFDSGGGIPHVYSNERLHQGLALTVLFPPGSTSLVSTALFAVYSLYQSLRKADKVAVMLCRATPCRHGEASAWVQRGAGQAGTTGARGAQPEQLGGGPCCAASGPPRRAAGRPPPAQDGQRHGGRHLQRGRGH